MNSALFARTNAVFQYPGDGVTDFSAQTGQLLAPSATAGLLVVNTSATVPATAICLDGQNSSLPSTMAVIGAGLPPVRMLARGGINAFQRVQQDATGGVIADAGAGAQRVVVGVALQAAVAGQYIMVAPLDPTPLDTW